ncbi:MAG: DUF2207 domain-containing protein [Oscillospiraceae bacterium]
MKKTAVLALLLFCVLALPAHADNSVDTIDISASICEDGSMYVTQVWQGSFDEGTENYIPMNAPDYLTITELSVSDKNGLYETVQGWDIDWSFEQKANRCGINYTDSGYEICFGISEYGQNSYTIEYKLDNVLAAYTDMDGVNFRFVNDDMNTAPTDVRLELRLADGRPITDEIADIWAFGFEGQAEFFDGAIRAYSTSPITEQNHVTLLLGMQKGVIDPARAVDGSFESVKQAAFDGSDYESEGSVLTAVLVIAGVVLFLLAALILAVVLSARGKRKRLEKLSAEFEYFREIPNGGNINATYELGMLFEVCEEGAILAAGMLHLVELNCLEPLSEEEVGFFGKTKETISLRLLPAKRGAMGEYDERLYRVLESAAGGDGILQARELNDFAEVDDELIREYIDDCQAAGEAYLRQKRCFERRSLPTKLKHLSESGRKEIGELLGFKKYLEDFSLIAERGVKELPIWRELLTYAMLFGIADKVAEQLKALYPEILPEVERYDRSVSAVYSYQYLLYNSMKNAEAARSSGSGGSASFGGGGGSIGGGSGGGSR